MREIPKDELEMICEREAIAVQDMEPATAQAAWEFRVERARKEKEENIDRTI